jgi:predicted metal-dependent enzyme (double-stranded beta helix superfamily)
VLRRLVENLRACSPPSLEIGSVLAARWEEWLPGRPLAYKPDGYTRTCAYRDPCFEVLLLNWAPGSASAIHDHGDQHCWMLVLEGNLDVDDYARLDSGETPGYAHVERCGTRRLEPGGMDLRSGRFDLHRVTATHDSRAVTLHVYSGPLRKFLVYDEFERRCHSTGAFYDQILRLDLEPAGR